MTKKYSLSKEELDGRVQRAVDYFMSGYGCGQSVVAAFADLYGMDEKTALCIGNGFGGGVGKLRMMCGAVSGMVILAGLESGKCSDVGVASGGASDGDASDSCIASVGRTADDIRAGKADCYRMVQDLLAAFKDENGSIICAELLGIKPKEGDHTPSERNAAYYKTRPCVAKVESAARIFANYLISR